MKIYRKVSEFPELQHTILTSGTFDGVHLGHQKIIQRLIDLKKQTPNAQTVVLTYHPHPRLVLFPEQKDLKILNTLEEKAMLFEDLGIDHLCIIPFNKRFASTSSENFIKRIIQKKLQTRQFVIGYDHRFGKNREGGFEYLKENEDRFGFKVEEISRQDIDDNAISSTRIRKALFAGDIETANELLGYEFSITGKVVKGKQIGRTIGYPTANLKLDYKHKLIPKQGIYAVRVYYKYEYYGGMLSIGVRPTIGKNLKQTIEVNIFDFDKDIYDKNITLQFVKYLRPEEKYNSLEELKAQLAKDKEMSEEVLKV
ncbi:bifunctional riboflavin kinase/FAD synthetase [Bernardetia sp.]|uniref:bifunctional riboflavin kinase/FAD synthetase n=1 Tax=Bernardetia sp. TaxID=1937974 RepID=UPI0025C63979|nr:bifunctional riboflavin kinase/FAD synthetase [Bernardetia sp.]